MPSYVFQTIDDPNAGTGFNQGTLPEGINASGQIVGAYLDANSGDHGFLLTAASTPPLTTPMPEVALFRAP